MYVTQCHYSTGQHIIQEVTHTALNADGRPPRSHNVLSRCHMLSRHVTSPQRLNHDRRHDLLLSQMLLYFHCQPTGKLAYIMKLHMANSRRLTNILTFGELLRKSVFVFRARIQASNNTIIQFMVNSVASLVSNLWKWWRTTLYTGNVAV